MTQHPQNTPRRVSIFGSTGSIGQNTLDVIAHLGGREAFQVLAVTGRGNTDLLARQAIDCGAQIAVTADETRYQDLKQALAGSGIEAAAGKAALIEAAERDADWFMAGIVGMAGLAPTLAAARRGSALQSSRLTGFGMSFTALTSTHSHRSSSVVESGCNSAQTSTMPTMRFSLTE